MSLDPILPWTPVLPEFALLMAALFLLLVGAFNGNGSARAVNVCAVLSFIIVGLIVFGLQYGAMSDIARSTAAGGTVRVNYGTLPVPGGFLTSDAFTSFIKIAILAAAAICLLIAPGYMKRKDMLRPEYSVLVMLSVLGMMLMVSASNFLMLYVGLELQSLALYVLAAFRRDTTRSSEAGLKYFVLGALASGLLLYGISLVYGFVGSLDYADIAKTISAESVHPGATVGMAFILAALAFKISAAPFHMWTPDVYEGAPTTVTAFFSVVPKLAGFAALMQVLFVPFAQLANSWQPLIVVLAALSMIVGAFGAIGQTSIKRLLAYSSIGHVGFALMALATQSEKGIEAVLLYLVFYIVMSVGAFAVVLLMRRDDRMVEEISDLAGISRLHPGMAAAMAILMFSMAGIPPLVGFFTKLYVFVAALEAGLIWLAIIGALSSVVGAYYYIRIIKVMYFDEPVVGFDQPPEAGLSATLVASSVLTLAGVVLLPVVALFATIAAKSLVLP